MLTKITLDNFKSFKNETTIDLTRTNYTILPQNVASNGVLKAAFLSVQTLLANLQLSLELNYFSTFSFWKEISIRVFFSACSEIAHIIRSHMSS